MQVENLTGNWDRENCSTPHMRLCAHTWKSLFTYVCPWGYCRTYTHTDISRSRKLSHTGINWFSLNNHICRTVLDANDFQYSQCIHACVDTGHTPKDASPYAAVEYPFVCSVLHYAHICNTFLCTFSWFLKSALPSGIIPPASTAT